MKDLIYKKNFNALLLCFIFLLKADTASLAMNVSIDDFIDDKILKDLRQRINLNKLEKLNKKDFDCLKVKAGRLRWNRQQEEELTIRYIILKQNKDHENFFSLMKSLVNSNFPERALKYIEFYKKYCKLNDIWCKTERLESMKEDWGWEFGCDYFNVTVNFPHNLVTKEDERKNDVSLKRFIEVQKLLKNEELSSKTRKKLVLELQSLQVTYRETQDSPFVSNDSIMTKSSYTNLPTFDPLKKKTSSEKLNSIFSKF